MLNNPIVFYALIFVAALLLVDRILRSFLSAKQSKEEIVNRLEALKQDEGTSEAFGELLKRRGVHSQGTAQDVGNLINRYIAQSGLEINIFKRILIFLGLMLIGFLIEAFFMNLGVIPGYIFTVVFALFCSILIVRYYRLKRIKDFTKQLPPAIDIIVRSLNAGHPLNAAISLVAREMPDPLGSEFGILNDQLTFGAELETAMLNMHERVGAPEINLLTVTVSVQRGTGGNLAEILENLSQMIRDRLMIKAKIRAISAEGRITARVMLAFPFGLYFMILFLVPTYYDAVWESGYGSYIVAGCLFVLFLGMLVIRKIVNFDF